MWRSGDGLRRVAPRVLFAAMASSTVTSGKATSISTFASRAACRAAFRVSAMTANSGCWWKSTSPSQNAGSSPATGEMSLRPGTSFAVMTATTPGCASTAERSMAFRLPAALGESPQQMCSSPAGSGMSSTYAAAPCTCRVEESCGIGRRTTESACSGLS
jgi:hypothetical protein